MGKNSLLLQPIKVGNLTLKNRIGGQINIAAVPPRKAEILRATEYYEKIMKDLDITIHFGTEATKDIMNAADAVIVAVGAHDITLPIEGADAPTVLHYGVKLF